MQQELPGYNMELVKKRIRELQGKYEKEIKPDEKSYNEQNTKKDFIEPILRVLNWDTETKIQVDAEFCIKNKRSSGSADYALKIDGEVKLLLEAKSFDKDLETGYDIVNGQKRTYVEQLVGYAFDLNRHMKTKIDYCILTNGKEWRIYNVRWQGVAFDKKLVFLLKIEEFLEKFRKFWSLERGNIAKGDIDRFVMEEDKVPIDRKAVTSLLYCKKLLVDSMVKDYENNKRDMKYMIDKLITKPVDYAPNGFPKFYEMPEDERLNKFVLEASSNVINKILFIRVIEDKGYLKPKLTKRSVEEWKSWFSQADRILRLFREACHEADVQYNGGIFDVNPYDTLNYDNDVLDKIIGILGDFNFEEIDADVIGRIYEIYLGTVLSIEEEIRGKKRTKLSADYTERKKLGQYYTPKFVVDYIVKNTLGKLLEGKTPKEISKIKILDPACGSGSFLIRSFDYLKDYYVRYNDQQMNKVKNKGAGDINNYIENGTIIDYNHKILKENLHGVDLNYLSTQVCSINLWLRALEKDKKLEKLSKNILHGNSLISGVEDKEELVKYKAELKEIAKLRENIKDYYGKELSKRERDELEEMETKLKELRNKVNAPLNENLKKYFDNLDLIYPFNWEVEFTEVFDNPEEKQGFDVVIGNPPYIDYREIFGTKFLNESFYSAKVKAKYNILILFIEQGLRLLKKGGRLGFIVSNQFLCSDFGLKIRDFILNNTVIENILDVSNINVFKDAATYPVIIILKKQKPSLTNIMHLAMIRNEEQIIEDKIKFNEIQQKVFQNMDANLFLLDLNKDTMNIIKKMNMDSMQLKDYVRDITWGTSATGYSKKKIDPIKYESLIKNKKEGYSKMIQTADIKRYAINWQGDYIPNEIYSKNKIDIFKYNKLVLGRVNKYLKASLDWEGYFLGKASLILSKDENKLKQLLAILNSKLMDYYYKLLFKSTHMAGGYVRYDIPYLERLPIKSQTNKNLIKNVDKILCLNKNYYLLQNKFNQALNNQIISDGKACKFEHYWNHSDLYDFSKETLAFANKTKAKILDMDIKEENNKLIIYTINISLVQNKKFENIKTIELIIKNDLLRKFLYYSFKKCINEKKGRGFGSGIILEVIKKMPIPVYVANIKMNLDKLKKVISEFEHETKDLWKIDGKTYTTLTEIEEDIEKTDKEIDDMVYDLYEITEKEKKIIEESLK